MARFSKLAWQKQLRGADLTASEYHVLSTVATYAGKDGRNAYPGVANLARDCRLEERSIKRILRQLEAKGWLVVIVPGGNLYGKGRATEYALGNGPTRMRVSEEGNKIDYQSLRDDYDLLERWLTTELGYDYNVDAMTASAALGMWESDEHPKAILNKIKSLAA